MELKNKELVKMIEKARLYELEERIMSIEDDSDMKQEGMTETEYILREAEWLVEDFEDDGCLIHDDLVDARRLLRETRNGKCIPIDISRGFRPKRGYEKYNIDRAKNLVNEYNRTKRFVERLGRMIG